MRSLAILLLLVLPSCGLSRDPPVLTAKVYYGELATNLYAYATDCGDGTGTIVIDAFYRLAPDPAVIQHELLHLLGAHYHNPRGCILEDPVRREYYDPPCEADMEIINGARHQMVLTVWDLGLYDATRLAIDWLNFWAGWELFSMEVLWD